jgi:NADH-quinone oxidoreductase subunit L
MFNTRTLIILIPLLPLLGAIVTAILGARVLKKQSHLPIVIAIIGSFLCSFMMLQNVRQNVTGDDPLTTIGYEQVEHLWTWANIPAAVDSGPEAGTDFTIDVTLRTDPLTAIMLVMVTFVASLVAIYGAGYMHGDRGYWRFFAYVGLFVFSMTMLVSVSNFLLLFVFWEAVGACSYLLIGFWYEKDSAAAAGKKAFLVNRVGDFGFVLALFLIWMVYGTWNFHDADGVMGVLGQQRLSTGDYVAGGTGLAICLLLMLGACGKSAQFPLHVWLADAMEGPTPVSALIHAATMVTAGVYMVTRCTPLFLVSPEAQMTVACIGGITALMAGLIAITQFDLKRVLAYSTLSQLGYMFLGLGTGTLAGITAGMFHLFTHAFFKALLFLGAGSVMHSMGGVIDMRRFGGLKKLMPITHITFLVGCLALAGLFPLSGFWSKDAIVGAIHDQAAAMQTASEVATASSINGQEPDQVIRLVAAADESATHAGDHDAHAGGHHEVTTTHLANYSQALLQRGATIYQALYYISLFTAFLTALYTFRAFFLTFYGEEEIPAEAGHHAHESPPSMWVPLAILAVFAAGVGGWLHWTHGFDNLLAQTPSLATAAALKTPLPGVFHMNVAITSSIIAVLGVALAAFFYLGNTSEAEGLAKLFSPLHKLSYGKFFWDEIYDGLIVKPLQLLAKLSYFFDRQVVDGIVNFFGWLPKTIAGGLRSLQVGLIPFYGLAMVLGMLTLLAARALWGNG